MVRLSARVRRVVLSWLTLLTFAAALLGCSRTKNDQGWSLTGTFDFPVTAADGTPFHYTMRGVQGRFGFIDAPFVAGKAQKYMWHFWGKPEELVGKAMEVTAVNRDGETVTVFSGTLDGALNGAVAHSLSSMSLPSPGLWRLEVRVAEQVIGQVVVEVFAAH